jgi:methylated-DNA-[protein]-cysteine S-methyltransferase
MKRLQKNLRGPSSADHLFYASKRFPIGEIGVVCSENGLREVSVRKPSRASRGSPCSSPSSLEAVFAQRALTEIEEFLSGRRREFTVPLDLQGTPFQLQVWNALLRIPYGETRSYGEVAGAVGRPKAARAVGMANHSNPVAIVVPCHRVVASDGSLGGYAGGLEMKSQLLRLEASASGARMS